MLIPLQHAGISIMPMPLQHCQIRRLMFCGKGFKITTVAQKTAISKYLAEIGRKGGKASGKARMEKLTPEQRQTVARTAATARWAKPVTQAELQKQTVLQVAEWETDRAAQLGAEEINVRLAEGAKIKPGKLTFDKKLKMAKASKKIAASTSAPAAVPVKNPGKSPAKRKP